MKQNVFMKIIIKKDCTVEENLNEKLKEFHCPNLSPKEAMAIEKLIIINYIK